MSPPPPPAPAARGVTCAPVGSDTISRPRSPTSTAPPRMTLPPAASPGIRLMTLPISADDLTDRANARDAADQRSLISVHESAHSVYLLAR